MKRYTRTQPSQGPEKPALKTAPKSSVAQTKRKPLTNRNLEGSLPDLEGGQAPGVNQCEPVPDGEQEKSNPGRDGVMAPGEGGERVGREPVPPCYFCGRRSTVLHGEYRCDRHALIKLDARGRIKGFSSLQYAEEHGIVKLPPGYVVLKCDCCGVSIGGGPWRLVAARMASAESMLCVDCYKLEVKSGV